MSKLHHFVAKGAILKIPLKGLFKGFTDEPVYRVNKVKNGRAEITRDGSFVLFEAIQPGLASFEVTVNDSEGSSMTRSIGIYVDAKDK